MKTIKKHLSVGIIGGTGKMGLWLAQFFQSKGLRVQASGSKTTLTNKTLAKTSDIVIVSVPIAKTEKVIKEILPHLQKSALLCDITSLKVFPLKAMEQAKCATLGMHPLFGPQIGTPAGQKIVFCRQRDNSYVTFLKQIFEDSGISIVEMSADEHDYHMAYIQALTHALNLLYAKIIFEQKSAVSKKLDTPLFILQSLVMGRVLYQDLKLSADIQMYNPYFLPLLENLSGYSRELLSILQNGDTKAFADLFTSEKEAGNEFANFSLMHTDKVLKLVSEVHIASPTKATIKHLPKSARVAYLGPAGTYSHQAAVTTFAAKSYEKVGFDTTFQIFSAVLEGDADFGIIPAGNSLEGTVKGTLDYLADFSVVVVGSFAMPIHHQFVTAENSLDQITVVVSHPQALAQCEQWLRRNIPKATISPSASTTSSLSEKRPHTGYIASEAAAKLAHLNILYRNIEDNPKNTTRFYVIAKNPIRIQGLSNKKTLLFLTIYNRVGILRDILNVIADNGINLTKLESRPSYEKIWDYHFFVEVEAEYTDPSLRRTLTQLESYCPVIRVLGQT